MVSIGGFSRTLWRRIGLAAGVVALTSFSLTAMAQTQTDEGHDFSSSTDYKAYISTDALLGKAAPAVSASAAGASPQYGSRNYPRYPQYQSRWSHMAFEAGGGFTAPVGNDTRYYDTWGYNITVGAGWNFSKRFGALIEYQFNKNKIPGTTIAAVGAQGGNINTWSFTIDPIIYQPITRTTGVYVTGGGGFYRKVTNFTDLVPTQVCYYFCYYGYAPVTVAHFSSNQGGVNIGGGFYWKAFGEDSNAKLYAEARYLWVDSPRATTTTNGEGTEGLIPVTFGIRF